MLAGLRPAPANAIAASGPKAGVQGWDHAYMRGTPHNSSVVLGLAIDRSGARPVPAGPGVTRWAGTSSRRGAGNHAMTNQHTKSGYAKVDRAILQQPGGIAGPVRDAQGMSWQRDEEHADGMTERISADSKSWDASASALARRVRATSYHRFASTSSRRRPLHARSRLYASTWRSRMASRRRRHPRDLP